MDKWKSKGIREKFDRPASVIEESSLLPPTRRAACETPTRPLDKRSPEKWSIDGFFKKVSFILEPQGPLPSSKDPTQKRRRRKGTRHSRSSSKTSSTNGLNKSSVAVYSLADMSLGLDQSPGLLKPCSPASLESRSCSDGGSGASPCAPGTASNGKRSQRRDRLKARAEAKRDLQLSSLGSSCASGSSSADEGCNHNHHHLESNGNGCNSSSRPCSVRPASCSSGESGMNSGIANGKRRSRASRTERYLKRMCGGGGGSNGSGSNGSNGNGVQQLGLPVTRVNGTTNGDHRTGQQFRPIERAPMTGVDAESKNGIVDDGIVNGYEDVYSSPLPSCDLSDVTNDSFYAHPDDIGVNPLVQQTLQYFSDFDRNMALEQQQHKTRKAYPGLLQQQQNLLHNHRKQNGHHHQDQNHQCANNFADALARPVRCTSSGSSGVVPPRPPSRDHTSRILVNGTSLDKYRRMMRHMQCQSEYGLIDRRYEDLDKENGLIGKCNIRPSPSSSPYSACNSEVSNINRINSNGLPTQWNVGRQRHGLSRCPLQESLNTTAYGDDRNSFKGIHSTELGPRISKSTNLSPSHFSPPVYSIDDINSNYALIKRNETEKPRERRSSKNLEEALYELEAIYNSLQLGDEELLERADKRTLEEFQYKGLIASPEGYHNEIASRRKTWADQTLRESEIPDRLKDDMAYRRMHPKERPSSCDGQSSLSSISYLMTSPIPTRRDSDYIDPKMKPRRKEPDVTLDDVVFRSMQHTNNTLKVLDPQPPFGIPLGPITTATESDYLHSTPSPRGRSPYSPFIAPAPEPDIVTDDLAYRNLRKDGGSVSGCSRQPSPTCSSPFSNHLQFNGNLSPLALNSNGGLRLPKYGGSRRRRTSTGLPQEYGSGGEDGASEFGGSARDEPLAHHSSSRSPEFISSRTLNRRISDPELLLGSTNWPPQTPPQPPPRPRKTVIAPSEVLVHSEIKESQRPLSGANHGDDENAVSELAESDVQKKTSRWSAATLVEHFDSEHKASSAAPSDKGSSYLSSSCSTPPPIPSRGEATSSIDPITEQEISVYKKLCQDLENLVQLTKGVDAVPEPTPSNTTSEFTSSSVEQSFVAPSSEAEVVQISSSTDEDHQASAGCVVEIIDCIRKDSESQPKVDQDVEMSPVKREISNILDNLKSLADDSDGPIASNSCEVEEIVKKEVKEVLDEPLDDPTKDSGDPSPDHVTQDDHIEVVQENDEQRKEEEEEKRDHADDNPFFQSLQLAKSKGEWKESTPVNRRINSQVMETPVAGCSTHHWEGETRPCDNEQIRMLCNNAIPCDVHKLTAKYIFYITNHVTAQYCLLLVFLIVLLFAIVTAVP
ncbi:hypothetical protein QAD02_004091 [Eretmocerus hayati]|uniref:Uncharacterized protein n=1 Tax=Eretmocerus hayati TaxID=131215 RepID=A0ACC2NNV3_9HYME|nr:hypothetical protein QAD02_004091 [Eretmocerus hayati]